MVQRAAPDYSSIPGLRHLYFTRRDEGDVSRFVLVTIWESIDAVHEFTGPNADRAKYYEEDERYLLELDETARNYRVFHAS
ncbi:MAG: antibiotic biosynthesis monooxygenase [Planctomycetota bacterium]